MGFVQVVVEIARVHPARVPAGDALLGALPVDRGNEVFVVLRGVDFQQRAGLLRVVGREEHPPVGRPLAGVRQVIVEAGHKDLESDIHVARVVGPDEGERALEVARVVADGHVSLRDGHAEARRSHQVLRVGRDERRTVVSGSVRDLDDLGRLEVPEEACVKERASVEGFDEVAKGDLLRRFVQGHAALRPSE